MYARLRDNPDVVAATIASRADGRVPGVPEHASNAAASYGAGRRVSTPIDRAGVSVRRRQTFLYGPGAAHRAEPAAHFPDTAMATYAERCR